MDARTRYVIGRDQRLRSHRCGSAAALRGHAAHFGRGAELVGVIATGSRCVPAPPPRFPVRSEPLPRMGQRVRAPAGGGCATQAPTPTWCATRFYRLVGDADVALYLKDESTHVTGSLKHRLARSLFLFGLCNGWITETTTIVEASSGSTAVSKGVLRGAIGSAVRRRDGLLDQPCAKIALIESHGGRCHFVEHAADVYAVAQQIADGAGGHFLDQFTNAERAT